jgi:tetratricopeptide (TPR) repeat protein
VEVKLDGHTVQGLNRFGGVAWERMYGGDKVALETWPAACGQPARSHITETAESTTATWRHHTHLLTLDGEELFDSTPLDGKDLGFRDPRRESSGTLVFDVLRWSRCQAPEPAALPVVAWNAPWYASVLGISRPGREIGVSFSFSGRVLSIAASVSSPASYAVVAGNHELLHTSAFAIVRADGLDGANPPRMVDQAMGRSALVSYTLLPLEIRTYGQDAVIAEADGSWKVCTPDDRCEVLDRFGNLASELRAHPGVDPEALLRDRMDRFRRLSEIDLSRRRGAYDIAEEGYRALAATPSGSAVEQAAIHLIGAQIAVARGDLEAVVARATQSEQLWSVTQDAALLRASARAAAGQYTEALRDLEAAEGRRAAARYNTTKTRFVIAWLTGDHDLAARLLDSIDFPVVQARLRALTLIEDGEPARALALLDPWTAYDARERVQLERALALVDLGRADEARRAVELELDRHPWLRVDANGVTLAIDVAAGRPVAAERVAAILVDADRRGRQDLDARMLLPRIRIDAAEALGRAGQLGEARQALAGVEADHPGTGLRARATRLTTALSSP